MDTRFRRLVDLTYCTELIEELIGWDEKFDQRVIGYGLDMNFIVQLITSFSVYLN